MDVAPVSTAVATTPFSAPPSSPVQLTAPLPRRPLDIVSAWPHSAQLAAAFLLGSVATLLGGHLVSSLRQGSEPSAIVEPRPVTYRVDLNEATRAELLQLPGIGPSMADRIESYRTTQGGFHNVEELRKVPGIGPATMEKLRPLVTAQAANPAPEVKPLAGAPNPQLPAKSKAAALKGPVDINTASLAELQTLPGIGPKLSQRIVDERERKAFGSVDDLRRVAGIGPKTMDRLKPLVTVGGPVVRN
jgi:competence protein ComEA